MKFFTLNNISFSLVSFSFLLKVGAGILLGLVYTHYYKDSGDTFQYFNDGNKLHAVLLAHPVDYLKILSGLAPDNEYFRENYFNSMLYWGNNDFDFFFGDSQTIIRINSIIRIFSFGVYNVHVVFFSFFSFAGLIALYRFFSGLIKRNHRIVYAGIFLLPSVAFWSSGALKEAVAIFAIGFFLHFSLKYVNKKSVRNGIMVLLFLFLLVLIKFYYLIALLPGISGYLWCRNKQNIYLKYFTTHIVWLLLLYSTRFIVPDYNVPVILSYKQNNFVNMAVASGSGSIFSTEKLHPVWRDIIKKSPDAFLSVLLNPLTFSRHKILALLSSLETVLVLLLLMAALIAFRKPEQEDYPLLIFALSFVIITFTLIGLTTPVAGALVRYKTITLPWLIFMLVYIIDFGSLKNYFSRTK
ncbi:MAG: hypothetical protein JJE25_06515 [Bacteroidia bacterium]|nr:hypothetical protein [Bacteroidia bacterium]